MHGCGRFFNALRDTTTDQFVATYRIGEPSRAAPVRSRARRRRRRAHRPVASRCASRSTASPTTGLQGDTLASALLANGVHLVGRSFKYHRPRGILAAGAEEPNALVTRARAMPARTHAEPARDAGRALRRPRAPKARTAGPALGFDLGRVNDLLSPLFPAGFYYKTFMWPRSCVASRL